MVSRVRYGSSEKPSAAVILLNIFIITLLCAVIIMLVLYLYTFYSGKKIDLFNNIFPDIQTSEVTEISTISSITEMTTTVSEVHTVVSENVSSDNDELSETAVTEPKYNSTKYDKEFYSNTMFIGDSIFTGFSGFGYLLPENVFAQVGLNPDSVLTKEIDGVTAVQKASGMQPERICIMLGTNGLAFLDISYMADSMGKLIEQLEEAVPGVQIVILSIPPVTEEHEKDNPEKVPLIAEYNALLAQTAEAKECKYIDIFTMLQDENGYLAEEYAEIDGLHFLGKAYGVVLSRVQYELSQETEETDNTEEVQTEAIITSTSELVTEVMEETEIVDVTETENAVQTEVTADTAISIYEEEITDNNSLTTDNSEIIQTLIQEGN